jgi:hypothetical protein
MTKTRRFLILELGFGICLGFRYSDLEFKSVA